MKIKLPSEIETTKEREEAAKALVTMDQFYNGWDACLAYLCRSNSDIECFCGMHRGTTLDTTVDTESTFDVKKCHEKCANSIRNTHVGKWLNNALNEIERLRKITD